MARLTVIIGAQAVWAVASIDLHRRREIGCGTHPALHAKDVEDAVIASGAMPLTIWTHSPYVIDHLNHLMALAALPEADRLRICAEFGIDPKACIPMDDVEAKCVELEGGRFTSTDILDREIGRIRWRTFSDVGDWMARVYDAIDVAQPRR